MTKEAKISNIICEEMVSAAEKDKHILAITCDSRGSASLKNFTEKFPKQTVEMGIAEQNAVSVSAGLAHVGERPFVFSPAAFLTMRSIEQVKDDVAYSNTNVKLIGISGGNSYSYLGTTHHSLQDLAITRAIPNLEVYMPADELQTRSLMRYLISSSKPAYVRIGKLPQPEIYKSEKTAFIKPGHANIVVDNGNDLALFAMGETLSIAVEVSRLLKKVNINTKVIDLVSLKPLDVNLIKNIAKNCSNLISIEEHSIYGGIGAAIAEVISKRKDTKLNIVGFPDKPIIGGPQLKVFDYYGLNAATIAQKAEKTFREENE